MPCRHLPHDTQQRAFYFLRGTVNHVVLCTGEATVGPCTRLHGHLGGKTKQMWDVMLEEQVRDTRQCRPTK